MVISRSMKQMIYSIYIFISPEYGSTNIAMARKVGSAILALSGYLFLSRDADHSVLMGNRCTVVCARYCIV